MLGCRRRRQYESIVSFKSTNSYPPALSLLLAIPIIKQDKKGSTCCLYDICLLYCFLQLQWRSVMSGCSRCRWKEREKFVFLGHEKFHARIQFILRLFNFENFSCQPFNLLHPCCIIHTVRVLYCTVYVLV